jgi:hypothetical protein
MAGLYLGTDRENNSPVEIPSALLSKHVAILGTIGSGKTVAAKVLLEEATLAGIPSIIIDGEGDIAQMAFKETVSELKRNNVDVSRANILNDKAEFRIWTPASELGLPLSINPFGSAPSSDEDFDPNASLTIASIDLMASGFSAICGYSEQNKLAQVKGFLNEILMHAVAKKNMPDSFSQLAAMVSNIQAHLEIMGLEADEVTETVELITDSDRKELSRRLRSLNTGVNRLLFQSGVALDPQTLVTPIEQGYTPVNIILTSKLPDEDTKQKFVAELSRSLYKWGSSSPEALKIVYFVDEAHQFLPPNRSPASKAPLMTLFRKGRHCGIACIVASQQLTDIDYKALGNVNTKLIGLVTDSREREKLKGLFTNATNPKECLDSLSIAKPGEFMLICPEKSRTPIPIQVRWLYRMHGRKVTDADIKKIVTSKQRKWAKNVQEGLEHRLSGLRTYQSPEISNSSDAASNEIEEELDLGDDAPTSSSIESQDSVFAGDVTQRTIHGAENVNINFNLNSIDTDEMNAIKDSLQKGFSITELNVSQESANFAEMVEAKLNENIRIAKNDFVSKWNQIEQNIGTPRVSIKFSVFKSLIVVLLCCVILSYAADNEYDIWNYAVGSKWAIFATLLITILFVFIWAFDMASKLVVMKANRHYHKLSLEYLKQREVRIRTAIKDFRVSSNYSNQYHQTKKSEFKVIGFISEFTQVILRRRAHRKFATNAKDSAQWISDLNWDQIVSISIDEYTKVLIGEELNFDAQTWAKREVMAWD